MLCYVMLCYVMLCYVMLTLSFFSSLGLTTMIKFVNLCNYFPDSLSLQFHYSGFFWPYLPVRTSLRLIFCLFFLYSQQLLWQQLLFQSRNL